MADKVKIVTKENMGGKGERETVTKSGKREEETKEKRGKIPKDLKERQLVALERIADSTNSLVMIWIILPILWTNSNS